MVEPPNLLESLEIAGVLTSNTHQHPPTQLLSLPQHATFTAAVQGAAAAVTFGIARRASNLVPRGVLPTAAGEWGARVRRGVQRDAFRFCLLARWAGIDGFQQCGATALAPKTSENTISQCVSFRCLTGPLLRSGSPCFWPGG